MSQKLLKIKIYQPFANFRKPFSYGIVDSFPLPPPSTVKGWLHNVLGAKNGEYFKMAVSICGRFNSVVYDIQRIIKFDRPRGEVTLPELSARVVSSIIYVTNLVDVELCIHVNSEKEVLERIYEDIFTSYWGLGRKEDLMQIESVGFFEPRVIDYRRYIKQRRPNIGMYLKNTTGEKFMIDGIRFRLNNRYEKTKNGLRVFTDKKDVVFIESLEELNGFAPVNQVMVDDENILIDLIGDEEYESQL